MQFELLWNETLPATEEDFEFKSLLWGELDLKLNPWPGAPLVYETSIPDFSVPFSDVPGPQMKSELELDPGFEQGIGKDEKGGSSKDIGKKDSSKKDSASGKAGRSGSKSTGTTSKQPSKRKRATEAIEATDIDDGDSPNEPATKTARVVSTAKELSEVDDHTEAPADSPQLRGSTVYLDNKSENGRFGLRLREVLRGFEVSRATFQARLSKHGY
jgi:hypothetical protein